VIRRLTLATADLSATAHRRELLPTSSGRLISDDHRLYDRTTLWYDAIWRDGLVILVCPKLYNFAPLLQAGTFTLDGQVTKISRLRIYKHLDVIELKSDRCPTNICFNGEGVEVTTAISNTELERFAGLNTHFTMSRNDKLQWIHDFALYHRNIHKLQGMVLFDNGSTDYPLSAIEEVLQAVGLKEIAIVSVPLLYGRPLSGLRRLRAQFLQRACMNIARLRFLGLSRAVLNADIDELVWSDGLSVFDKTVNSLLGYSTYGSEWVYPQRCKESGILHNDHDHILSIPSPARATIKWCIVPQGPLRHMSWDVHCLTTQRLPLVRRIEGSAVTTFLRKRFRRNDIGFFHCKRITTDWKGKRHRAQVEEIKLHEHPRARTILDRAFSPQKSE